MAPLLKLTIQFLANLPYLLSPQTRGPSQTALDQPKLHVAANTKLPSLSITSWGKGRQDIFGIKSFAETKDKPELIHKYYDGAQWQPAGTSMEILGNFPGHAHTAVSSSVGRMDFFAASEEGELLHKYFDTHGDNAWQPSWNTTDTLYSPINGTDKIIDASAGIAATSWAANRIDVFARNAADGQVLHKFFDGSTWQPEGGDAIEVLGGSCGSGVAALSWGVERNNIFCAGEAGRMLHMYWDGSMWSEWQELIHDDEDNEILEGRFEDAPAVASRGPHRLDVLAVDVNGELWHKVWDSTMWLKWTRLASGLARGGVAANSWSEGRIDVVALGQDNAYVGFPFSFSFSFAFLFSLRLGSMARLATEMLELY